MLRNDAGARIPTQGCRRGSFLTLAFTLVLVGACSWRAMAASTSEGTSPDPNSLAEVQAVEIQELAPQSAPQSVSQSSTQPTTQPTALTDARAINVALWRCELVTTGDCFSPGFLLDARRRTGLAISPAFMEVRLDSEDVFTHPFAVLSGDGALLVTDAEAAHLRQFVEAGGFLVVSANCTSVAFDVSFRELLGELWPQAVLEPLGPAHRVYHAVYEIEALRGQKVGGDPQLLGMTLGGRLSLVYAPNGVNATGELGRECCCCGGDELANARPVLVNLLVSVLTGESGLPDGEMTRPAATGVLGVDRTDDPGSLE